jgi:hypothetical protein
VILAHHQVFLLGAAGIALGPTAFLLGRAYASGLLERRRRR